MPNEDGKLHIGMTTQNSIIIQAANDVLTVANQAIQRRDGKKTVRVLDENDVLREVEIQTGLSDGIRTEVVSGLKEGEQVVTAAMTAAEAAEQGNMQMRGPRM